MILEALGLTLEDYLVLFTLVLMLWLMLMSIAARRRNPEVEQLREQVKTLRELLKAKEAEFEAELRRVARASKLARELDKAVRAGAVRLTCPIHRDKDVTILSDGTIICEEGHRLWPPGEEEVKLAEGGGHG